jgi:cardiolipin synthase
LSRKVVLARQLLVDTAVASRPVKGPWALAAETGADLRAVASGVFYSRIVLPLTPPPPPLCPARPSLNPAELERELRLLAGNDLRPADVHLFVAGHDALAALHQVIDQATCRIDVLMYIWESDPLGEDVARRLAARAAAGVHVRVLVDGGGNLIHGQPAGASVAELNRVVCRLLRQPNVELLRSRNPAARFDHRKLVLADGQIAWSGGRNFTLPSFAEHHDLSYTLTGPLAAEMADVFESFWRMQGGTAAPPLPEPPLAAANASARLVRTRPGQRDLASVLYRAVERARHHVYLENPYLSDPRLLAALIRARHRGADVRVVLTLEDDREVVNRSNKVTANRLLRAGVRVYFYPGMTHTKAASVDGCLAYLGTGNFDALSLRHNRELGLAVGAGSLPAELEAVLFLPDFCPVWEVTAPLPLTATDYVAEILAALFL